MICYSFDEQGCQENHDMFKKQQPSWSALRSDDYGYSRLTVHNQTHLFMDYVSIDKLGAVIDQFWLVKENHGSYKVPNVGG
uniref:Purple acid phosphatase C-terminal domain-containing protein n=1 Tax=Timema shepardi TaxID=629360 RepID=A0A7R9B9G8_TIMSH|nr:unnamed protein product [Timema shepardi]